MLSSRSSLPRIDSFSRVLIILASFFSIAALALSIVGLATQCWFYSEESNGNTLSYNLFKQCSGNVRSGSSICTNIPRETTRGVFTLHAAALLVVAICLLGCGMFIVLLMNVVQLTGFLVFIAPILLFLAALFMVAAFAEGSKVLYYNSYSVYLVQTAHVLTIFSMGIIAFAAGRLHLRYYQQF